MARVLPVERYGRNLRIPTPTGFAEGGVDIYVILPRERAWGPARVDTGVSREGSWDPLQAGLRVLSEVVGHLAVLEAGGALASLRRRKKAVRVAEARDLAVAGA